MDIPFKITEDKGVYQYLHVRVDPSASDIRSSTYRLQVYLLLAHRLSLKLDCYANLPYSPYLEEMMGELIPIHYRYQLLADDYEGLVDKGFERIIFQDAEKASQKPVIFYLKDLMTLRCLPEDTFGDKASAISIYLLHTKRINQVTASLQTDEVPVIGQILEPGEVFIHLICGKEQGYFDGMVIYTLKDIAEDIRLAILNTQISELL